MSTRHVAFEAATPLTSAGGAGSGGGPAGGSGSSGDAGDAAAAGDDPVVLHAALADLRQMLERERTFGRWVGSIGRSMGSVGR